MTSVVQKTDLDRAVKAALTAAHTGLLQVSQIKQYVDALADTDLIAIGYDQDGVNNLRAALNVMDELRVQYQNGAVGTQKDYQTFARRVFGLGV